MRTDRINFLALNFDTLTFREVQRALESAGGVNRYAYVVTPNVDHLVRIHREPALRQLYEAADLCLCDSRILRFLARLRGINLPLVPGSDLAAALFARVIKPGDTIAIVGGNSAFLDRLRGRFPGVHFDHHPAPMGLRRNQNAREAAAEFIARTNARFTFITVGSPQQEMIARDARERTYAKGVSLCVGAGLEFLTGEQKRAPRWLRALGLEWLHRLANNPRRLWRRYLIEGMRIIPIYLQWRRGRWWPIFTGFILALLGITAAGIYAAKSYTERRGTTIMLPPASIHSDQIAVISLPPPNLLRPLTPAEAAKENADRPFVSRPDTSSTPFVLRTDSQNRDRALTCLTQAVYYEAAGEGADGGRAVAQVVLNRLRHPGYPASVCGVVYQGSDRPTGCQFTFTCDGSLLRPHAEALWTRSRKIAEAALDGHVFAPVGHATHYHADYVLPYWADSLDKTVQIGRHIFYRLRGSFGDSRAFLQRYAGTEPPLPSPLPPAVVAPLSGADEQQLAKAVVGEDSKGVANEVEKIATAVSPLVVDSVRPTLVVDQQISTTTSKRRKSATECTADDQRKKLTPLTANDMRAAAATSGC